MLRADRSCLAMIRQGEAIQGEAIQGEALQGEALQGEALQGEALCDDTKSDFQSCKFSFSFLFYKYIIIC